MTMMVVEYAAHKALQNTPEQLTILIEWMNFK